MSPSMSMPRPSDEAKEAFRALVPDRAGVTIKPMFGNISAFVNGNMFTGLFGDDLFVRVGEEGRDRLLDAGGRDFEPMPGRVMRGYVLLPPGWRTADDTGHWIDESLAQTGALPAKEARSRKR